MAARCRNSNDEAKVTATLTKHLKRSIDKTRLFAVDSKYMPQEVFGRIPNDLVLTFALRRMIVLCAQACNSEEPVLMVGETGCGKTTVSQVVAEVSIFSGFFVEFRILGRAFSLGNHTKNYAD